MKQRWWLLAYCGGGWLNVKKEGGWGCECLVYIGNTMGLGSMD
jgi:hypothetical protein